LPDLATPYLRSVQVSVKAGKDFSNILLDISTPLSTFLGCC
jgi:hypothetical protein